MQKSEFETVIETIPDAVVIADRNGNIIYANHAAETILGLSRDEILKRSLNASHWRITTPEGKPISEDETIFNRVIRFKKPIFGIAYTLEHANGTRIVISINAVPLFNESGEVKSVVTSFTDITEQKKAAEEISESRRQVLDILESITDAFYALDNDWRLTYVNHRAEELFGVKREQLLFRNIWQVIRKENSPLIFEKYHQAKEQIAPVVFTEYSSRLKKWLEMHVYPYQNGLSVYIRDVTARKQAEKALRDSERHLEEAQRMAHVGSWDRDLEAGRIYMTDEAYRIFGLTSGKRYVDLAEWHKQWLNLLHPEDRERLRRAYEDALNGIRPYNEEYRIIRPNGEVRFINSRARVVRDKSGKPHSVFGVMQDITDPKQAEQERAASLYFFESMDRINRAILATNDLEQMMRDVLDVVLSVLNCDRAVLTYPCDPSVHSWTALMERTRPEYPGLLELGITVPMDQPVAEIYSILLSSDGPVSFGPGSKYPLPPQAEDELYSIKSFIGMAVYPKIGKPWQFGLHQCSYPRVWTPADKSLFQEIGRRLTDGLSSLLIYKELQKSVKKQ
jgi:PAS domain S-box-containing protein